MTLQKNIVLLISASSNDKPLQELVKSIDGEIEFDDTEQRLHCFGHIINLLVKSLLFGSSSSEIEAGGEEDNGDHFDL